MTNVADPRGLAGLADSIFLGVVAEDPEPVGTERLGRLPETQYRVEVKRVIKGELGDETVVNQLAGRGHDGDTVFN